MATHMPLGAGAIPAPTATDPTWTVQCAGLPGRYCGLVTVGPLAGQRLPWIDGASSTYCPDCYQQMMAELRARRERNEAS